MGIMEIIGTKRQFLGWWIYLRNTKMYLKKMKRWKRLQGPWGEIKIQLKPKVKPVKKWPYRMKPKYKDEEWVKYNA